MGLHARPSSTDKSFFCALSPWILAGPAVKILEIARPSLSDVICAESNGRCSFWAISTASRGGTGKPILHLSSPSRATSPNFCDGRKTGYPAAAYWEGSWAQLGFRLATAWPRPNMENCSVVISRSTISPLQFIIVIPPFIPLSLLSLSTFSFSEVLFLLHTSPFSCVPAHRTTQTVSFSISDSFISSFSSFWGATASEFVAMDNSCPNRWISTFDATSTEWTLDSFDSGLDINNDNRCSYLCLSSILVCNLSFLPLS